MSFLNFFYCSAGTYFRGYGRAPGNGGRIAELFNPSTLTFTAIGSLAFPSECEGYAATLLSDGTVLVTGAGLPGSCTQSAPVAEIFNPAGL